MCREKICDRLRCFVSAHGTLFIHEFTFYLEIHRTARRLRAALQKKEQIAEGLNSNGKRQRPDRGARIQNRNRSCREIDNKFPGGATRNSLPVLVASRRAHVSRSSAAASEQWGFGCTIFNGDNPTCREGLVARESNLLCHRIT